MKFKKRWDVATGLRYNICANMSIKQSRTIYLCFDFRINIIDMYLVFIYKKGLYKLFFFLIVNNN